MPEAMEEDDLESTTQEAMALLKDEQARAGGNGIYLGSITSNPTLSNEDLESLRKRLPFLADFSDEFIRSRPMESILKIETTSLKIRQMEQSRDHEDRLASNKIALESSMTSVAAGQDNRWSVLHRGRFLPGAACSAAKSWLTARSYLGIAGMNAVASYDMAAVGLGGFVTSRGWIEIHNPGSARISLRMFSINNCGSRMAGSKAVNGKEDDLEEILEIGEFKLALRALRVAGGFFMPWNMAYIALENFMIQTEYCQKDLAGTDRQALILTQFVDYVLGENGKRWRDSEPFLDTGALREAWNAFYGARNHSAVKRTKDETIISKSQKTKRLDGPKRQWIDVCFPWNAGRCLKPASSCTTKGGIPLRHVCNHVADRSKPDVYCGKDHACHNYHKNG